MSDHQKQAIMENQPIDAYATGNESRPPGRRWRPYGVLVAFGLALLVTSTWAVRPTTADEGTDAVAQLLRGLRDPAAGSMSATAAKVEFAEIVQQLGEVQTSVQKCAGFLERFGERPPVARFLRRIETRPGRGLFTSPETIAELERVVGKPSKLGQRDLELCAQLRDRGVGSAPGGGPPANLAVIATRVGKCLARLQGIGPQPAVVAQLRRLSRDIGEASFTSQARLAGLERAAGRELGLSVRELETCVDAYDTKIALAALTSVGVSLGSAIDCPPPGELCQGTEPGNQVCCTGSLNICAQSCDDDGDCLPYCEPCFPSDATVSTEDGSSKRMTELRIGDRVAVIRPDGSRGFDDIYLFTHKDEVSSAPYLTLTLESGRRLSLSPRHFIPVATGPAAAWQAHVLKGGNEVRVGDVVWVEGTDGAATASPVIAIANEVRTGLFNPLTLGGTILVDGVAASAHSNWFLDGLVSADTQGKVYQAIFLPVRAIYHLIGPARMETVAEQWGVVDALREATTRRALGAAMGWASAGLAGLALALGGILWWRRRAAAQ